MIHKEGACGVCANKRASANDYLSLVLNWGNEFTPDGIPVTNCDAEPGIESSAVEYFFR